MKTDPNLVSASYAAFIKGISKNKNNFKLDDFGKIFFLGKDYARVPAVQAFSSYCKTFNISSKKLLTFGAANDPEPLVLKKEIWHDKTYEPSTGNNDIQNFNYNEKDYDLIMANQTFEHIVDIPLSIKCIYEHLAPDGYFYSNWPVLNIRHHEPLHFFTGITVTYINYILLKQGFSIVECGAWGNKEYINFIFQQQTWPDYTQLKNHSNELDCPCIGWVLAKK